MNHVQRFVAMALSVAWCSPVVAEFAATPTVTISAKPEVTGDLRALPVHIGGRAIASALPAPTPRGALRYAHEWPGVYFEARFVGERVVLKFDDSWNEYRLIVDEAAPIPVLRPGRSEIVVTGLARGVHRVRLEKVTESVNVVGSFDGFYIWPNARALRVPARARQIEFIGPSSMTGYGTRSRTAQCDVEAWRSTTDTQQAYTALVAKHYDADYQIDAISGRGLVRNLQPAGSEPGLAALYSRTMPSRAVRYVDPAWRPQIVEIAPWVDFMSGVPRPGERWRDLDGLLREWREALSALVADLHRTNPNTAILIDWPAEKDVNPAEAREKLKAAQQQINAAAEAAGVRTLLFPNPNELGGKLELTGCDRHANVEDNARIANWLIGYLDAHPGLWGAE